jgi:ubiquinone/menaquinone biosynthesis C-methylase UbiE
MSTGGELPGNRMQNFEGPFMSATPSELSRLTTERGTANYALGHSPTTEIRRLGIQAAILRPITMRLLRGLGVSPGMRILDVGCWAGDVALLAGELVGESGAVVGIDRSEAAILAARARAATAKSVHFLVASLDDTLDAASFDVVIGRYVLIFQDDVPSFIRVSARLAKPGGILAFHEIDDADDFAALPEVPLWKQANDWLMSALRSLVPNPDVPGRLVDCFS